MIRLFLDANIFFAGFYSKTGASSLILQLASKKKWQIIASKLVLHEADRNLRKKSDPKSCKAFHRYLQQNKIIVVPAPEEKTLNKVESLIHPKDVPVLAAAIESGSDFLLTLDRRHFLTSNLAANVRKPRILTPGDFLRQQLI